MSRASSSRAAIESRMPRIICEEIAMRPMRSRSNTAMGASNTGGRSTASPGSANRKPLTQSISGNRRMTCRKANAMPMASTAMINALSPGLARKAAQICRYSTITTSAHSVRNTTIRTRKIRGDESLNGSMSCAMVMGSAPPSSPDNKARTRRKEEPRPPPGADPRRQPTFRWALVPARAPPRQPDQAPRIRQSEHYGVPACRIAHGSCLGWVLHDFVARAAPGYGRKRAANLSASRRSGRSRRRRLVGVLQRAQQLAVDVLVGREDAAGLDHVFAPVEIGDEAAGFPHQRNPAGHIPRGEAALPIGVHAPRRDPGEVERGGSEATQSGDLVLHRDVLVARELHVTTAGVREGAGDHRVPDPSAPRHPQPLIVQEGALAAFGGEHLIGRGIIDKSGNDRAVALECDRNCKVRDAMQKVHRAVDRIDDPAVGLVAALPHSAFLADEGVAGARLFELLPHDLLGASVRRGDEIGRPLERDLQVLELAEITLERAARLARGLDHHVEEGGAEHRGARRRRWPDKGFLDARALARDEARVCLRSAATSRA